MNDSRLVNYSITNSFGQRIYNGDFKSQINFKNIASGIYILTVKDGQRKLIRKIAMQ